MKLEDGMFLSTPANSPFGSLEEGEVFCFDQEGRLLGGKNPTKKVFSTLALSFSW